MNAKLHELMYAISSWDKPRIRDMAISILNDNKAQKDEQFCKQMITRIKNSSDLLEPLPSNISHLAFKENVQDFNGNRYLITKNEKILKDKIMKKQQAYNTLKDLNIRSVNSILLYGASGCGKTTFAKYLAHSLNLPYIYVNMSFIIDSHLGQSAKNIQDIFNYIKDEKCVFMLDELDTIGLNRGLKEDVGEISRICISLMQNIDRLNNDVILISATNRIDDIDKALISRFTIKHEFNNFHISEIEEYIINYLKDIDYTTTSDISSFALECKEKNLSNREIEHLLVIAIADAISQNSKNINLQFIEKED